MNLEQITSIANTLILLGIFLYQVNKNKILLERINQQKAVIEETKAIVTHQSTAIESQGKVVDTAIKYSESFSADKLENIVRREVELQYKTKIAEIEQKFKGKLSSKEEENNKIRDAAKKVLDLADGQRKNLTIPLAEAVTFAWVVSDLKMRNEIIAQLKTEDAKNMILSGISVLRESFEEYGVDLDAGKLTLSDDGRNFLGTPKIKISEPVKASQDSEEIQN